MSAYFIKAVLSNAQHPQYGQTTIPFPIPNEEYDQTIEMLEALKMGDALRQDCRVDGLDSRYSVLNRLVGKSVNVDELDYLSKRLDSFDAGENLQFQAMAHKLHISNIKDFINLTFCCQQATVITNFSDLEKIGKDHMMTLNGGMMPVAEYQAVDGRKEALQLIQSGRGTVTPFGVVYDNGMVLKKCYNGHQFPAFPDDCPLIVLKVAPKQGLAEERNPEYLYLPTTARQMERTLLRVGITALPDAQVYLDFDELPDIIADALDLDSLSADDLPALNRMCQAIAPMGDAELEKLNAVVLMTETSGAVSICRLAENLEQFDFVPGVHSPEEYGRYMIRQSGHFEYDENLEGFYDYRLYGEQRVEAEGGQFNQCGYVAYHGTVPLEELMRGEPTEQHSQEQGPQMGSM